MTTDVEPSTAAPAVGEPALSRDTTHDYRRIYSYTGKHDVSIWRPIPAGGYFIIGDYAQKNNESPTAPTTVFKAVNDDPKNPLMKPPLGYALKWNGYGTKEGRGAIWLPRAPDGYVSVGCVATETFKEPDLENYACLRQDLAHGLTAGPEIWDDKGSGAKIDVSLYPAIGFPYAVSPYTFVASSKYDSQKLEKNDFRLKMVNPCDFSFDVQEYDLLSGQWGGVTCVSDETGATITVRADRDGSKETANWFKKAIADGSAVGCQTTDALPEKLNFAFKGTLSFTHGGQRFQAWDVVIAQGHTTFERNNWWIGGRHMAVPIDIAGVATIATQPVGHKIMGKFMPNGVVIFSVIVTDVSSMNMGIQPIPVPQ